MGNGIALGLHDELLRMCLEFLMGIGIALAGLLMGIGIALGLF